MCDQSKRFKKKKTQHLAHSDYYLFIGCHQSEIIWNLQNPPEFRSPQKASGRSWTIRANHSNHSKVNGHTLRPLRIRWPSGDDNRIAHVIYLQFRVRSSKRKKAFIVQTKVIIIPSSCLSSQTCVRLFREEQLPIGRNSASKKFPMLFREKLFKWTCGRKLERSPSKSTKIRLFFDS